MTEEALSAEASRGTVVIDEGVGYQAPLRAVLTDGSPWETGTGGEKNMGIRSKVSEDLEEEEDQGSSWDDSSLAKFSKTLGFSIVGVEGEILKLLLRLKSRRDQDKKKGISGMTKFDREVKKLEWSINYEGESRKKGSDRRNGIELCVLNERLKSYLECPGGVVRSLGVGRFLDWGVLNARGAAGGGGPFTWSGGLNNQAMSRWVSIRNLALDKVNLWDSQEKLRPLSLEDLEARKVAKGDFEKWALMEEDQLTDPGGWHPSMEGLDFNRIGDEDASRLEEVFSEKEGLQGSFRPKWGQGSRVQMEPEFDLPGPNPKKVGAEDLRDFRPISLVGGLYKLLAKVLANRLKKFVGKVVSSAENAFVEGRQILDAALIANEAIDSLLNETRVGMGFGEKWTGWISWCISTATFSVLINGTPEGYFNSSRGCVKGIPYPLIFFVIGMEALSRLIHKACFVKLLKIRWFTLSWLLMWFEAISGLRINLDKSEILPVGRVENLETLALEAGCKVGKLPSYLGDSFGGEPQVCGCLGWGRREISETAGPCGRGNLFPKEGESL
ncbi:hypothetical protein CK203_090732 [Vitis vinifera]|uniref:Reverse transcriptase domain-containing protein n=1 Tax=Vitis vinifera TaxID=29760 RepID=A0A438CJW4_VITVI|nr:hypothetical protein CK203_090732 [Vitis vinifera]